MKSGDRVRVKYLHNISNKNIKPFDIGTIIAFKYAEREGQIYTLIGVEFERNIKGHSCEYRGKEKHCAWISKKRLEVIK